MSDTSNAMNHYLVGLRNHHAVETQAVETVGRELSRMEPYPELHAQMKQEINRSKEQRLRIEQLLSKYDKSPSTVKETVTNVVGKVSGLAHMTASDEIIKNVLAAIGFKAYEIGSYKVLITLAKAANASDDAAVLERSMKEEMEMGDWLGEHIPGFVTSFLKQAA